MKKTALYLGLAALLSFSTPQVIRADEVSDLREQVKTMQRQMDMLQKKIESLEAKKQEAPPKTVEERLWSLEQRMEKTMPVWLDKIKLTGGLCEYYVIQGANYFGRTSSHFLETTARIGVEAQLDKNLYANILLTAQNASGDAKDYTGVTTDDWDVEPEFAYLTYSNILDKPLSVTVGRQNLEYGDGFLVYDGFTDTRAGWSCPIRSFYAAKAVYELKPLKIDIFSAMSDEDYRSFETYLSDATTRIGKRYLYGTNLHFENEKYGTGDLGIFYKEDKSILRSDTLAISQRLEHTFDFWPQSNAMPQLKLSGEAVEEFGRTKVKDNALTDSRYDRRAFGGHLDTTLSFTRAAFSPYVKASYIYLPGDNPNTNKNEAFDPMFYGFKDWGKWLIGSINSYNLFNYNERVVAAEIGLSPTKTTLLRGQYYYFRLDKQITANAGKDWSHELNLIFDFLPNDWFFGGIEFGYALPLKAAKAYAGHDEDTTECILWAGVKF